MGKVYGPEEFKVPCEVYSRVVGYIRPVNQWNPGKVAEFMARKTFDKAFKAVKAVEEKPLSAMTKAVVVEVEENIPADKRLD